MTWKLSDIQMNINAYINILDVIAFATDLKKKSHILYIYKKNLY